MYSLPINYFDQDQQLNGELIYSDTNNADLATIILFHAFEGRGEFTLNYAKRLVQEGFNVFVADMYGDAKISNTVKGCFELIGPFLHDRALVRHRALLAYDTLVQQKGINKHKIGALGFCFGGMCVLELARSGVDLASGVTVHGALTKSDLPTKQIKTNLLFLHGYQDPQVPPQTLIELSNELKFGQSPDWAFTFFGHAKHSFTDPKTGTFDPVVEKEMGREYNPLAAQRAYRYIVDFFNEQFK